MEGVGDGVAPVDEGAEDLLGMLVLSAVDGKDEQVKCWGVSGRGESMHCSNGGRAYRTHVEKEGLRRINGAHYSCFLVQLAGRMDGI